MASCKVYRVLKRLKKAKKNVIIADFSKIETRLKVLYMRLKGIPKGGLKALQIKGFKGTNKNKEPSDYVKINNSLVFATNQGKMGRVSIYSIYSIIKIES